MGWYEYSCCGHTFTRMTRHEWIPVNCPCCFRPVYPSVSWHIKRPAPRGSNTTP